MNGHLRLSEFLDSKYVELSYLFITSRSYIMFVLNREVMVCEDMFTSEDTGLNIEDVNAMYLTLDDMKSVSRACYHERISANLEALGYNPETFCPMFETVLPLQFQVLGETITSVSVLDLTLTS